MLFEESSSAHKEDSGSEQSITREDITRDKSSDFDDLSNENILRTPRKKKKRRIWQVNNNSGEESSAHESYDSSDVDSSEEDTRVLIKSLVFLSNHLKRRNILQLTSHFVTVMALAIQKHPIRRIANSMKL